MKKILLMVLAGCMAGFSFGSSSRSPAEVESDFNFPMVGPNHTHMQQLLENAAQKAGYTAHFAGNATAEAEEAHRASEAQALHRELYTLIASTLLTLPLVMQMAAMVVGLEFHLSIWLELLLATPVQVIIGARFYRAAWKALRARSGNMDVLVAMGTSTAYLYSIYLLITLGSNATGKLYFEASAVIITLILLGKYMEARAKRGTTAAIRQLMDLRPKTARVLRNGQEIELPVAQLIKGDLVIVRPGENIPVDGELTEGSSEVDESLITGESIPVEKQPGDKLTGGSINGTGLMKITATARRLNRSERKRVPVQSSSNRLAKRSPDGFWWLRWPVSWYSDYSKTIAKRALKPVAPWFV